MSYSYIFNSYNEIIKFNKLFNKIRLDYIECDKKFIDNKIKIEKRGSKLNFEEMIYFTSKFKCKEFKYPYCICWKGLNKNKNDEKNILDIFIDKNNNNKINKNLYSCFNNKKLIFTGDLYKNNLMFDNSIDICYYITEKKFEKWKNKKKINNIINYNYYFKFFYIWLDNIGECDTYTVI